MLNKKFSLFILMCLLTFSAAAVELVIGEARAKPGIVFIFEGAVKDEITPVSMHLSETDTDVHIEARVNWDEKNIPEGTPPGGFVPYLRITSQITNQKTGASTFVDLLPHLNLIDNFHYARNVKLPGGRSDLYEVKFTVNRPSAMDLGLHRDWVDTYGKTLMKNQSFQYRNINFKEIAESQRK